MANPPLADAPSGPVLEPPVRNAIDEFRDESIRGLEKVLTDLEIDVQALWSLPRWNAETEPDPADRPSPAEVDRAAADAVGAAIATAAGHPAGAALLGLYLWMLCSDAWEHTYQFHRLTSPLRAFREQWIRHRRHADEPSRAVGDAVSVLAGSLIIETEVESALCRGELDRQAVEIRRAIACGERLGRLGEHLEGVFEPVPAALGELAESLVDYYRAVATAVATATALLEGRPAPDGALESLREAEEHFADDRIYRSEIRAHRRNLERIATAADREWLTVDDARVVYLYPFGLNGIEAADAVGAVRGDPGPVIAGIEAAAVRRSFELDDVWAGSDYLNRRFGGTAIELPPVVLRHEDGGVIAELDAEVRLSELGNHYLRLETDLDGCGPHELHFTMFRAAAEHAVITVACDEGAQWDRLSDFARDVQQGMADWLSRKTGKPVKALSGRYRVLLSIFDASAGRGPGAPEGARRPVESGMELLDLFGSQAVLPAVPNGISSICDWAGATVDKTSLLADVGGEGDLVASTVNSTVTAFLDSPSFIIGMFETVSEFVGSLDGLFSAWHDRLADHHKTVKELIASHSGDGDAADLAANVKLLREEQLELHNFAAEARSVLSLIHSPNLMTSPKDIEILLKLLRSAEVDRQELDFAGKLQELLGDRLEVHIKDLAADIETSLETARDEQDRKHQARVQAILGAVAVFGIAGGVQILQGDRVGFEPSSLIAVIGIAVLAVVVFAVVLHWSDRPKRPKGERRPAVPAPRAPTEAPVRE
ncbi:hypothetical protein LO763_19320 [Glycomyces sp. A-F 0318]|uniref:hypothetical protein n=1 Tax=Glycomyces amatae TaxID=2881355 RepID=UPI001E30D570|nr:hypothetical protein [Glycomyces amatae]MCD0445762.1 hypothetical protein [Glycomyces amatae]